MRGQPTCDQHLLLVAAGQVLDELVRIVRTNVQLLHVLVDDLVGFLLRNRLEHASRRLQGDQNVLADRQIANNAFVSTVLRGVCDLVAQCRVRIGDTGLLAFELVRTGIRLVRTVQQSAEFGSSGSQQACEADNLAWVDI